LNFYANAEITEVGSQARSDTIVRNTTLGRIAIMHAAAVDVLIRKSKFEPQVALGIAEAIDMAIQSAQLVTVSLLDARLATLEARMMEKMARLEARMVAKMEGIKSELVRWVWLVMLGNVALSAGATAILNALQR
jgi:hypothetical protein